MVSRRPAPLGSIHISDPKNDRSARSLPVHTACGIVLVGWAIRTDTVLVQASGLEANVRVVVDGQDVIPIGVHQSAGHESTGLELAWSADSWPRVTALELPPGTLAVRGERSVPRFGPAPLPSDVMPAHVAFWCRLFPRMRGC